MHRPPIKWRNLTFYFWHLTYHSIFVRNHQNKVGTGSESLWMFVIWTERCLMTVSNVLAGNVFSRKLHAWSMRMGWSRICEWGNQGWAPKTHGSRRPRHQRVLGIRRGVHSALVEWSGEGNVPLSRKFVKNVVLVASFVNFIFHPVLYFKFSTAYICKKSIRLESLHWQLLCTKSWV